MLQIGALDIMSTLGKWLNKAILSLFTSEENEIVHFNSLRD